MRFFARMQAKSLGLADIKSYNVSGYLAEHQQTIVESSQFCDSSTNTFFMRVVFGADGGAAPEIDDLRASFAALAESFTMDWELHDCATKPRVLIAVSKFGHCLNDLLHRWRSGLLPIEIPIQALAAPTTGTAPIEAAALAALGQFSERRPVRLLGVRAEFAQ